MQSHRAERGASLTGDESLELPEFDSPPGDPIPLLRSWFDAAERRVVEPFAAVLATCDGEGTPSSRVVLVKELEPSGALIVTTHYGSRKARDMDATRRASVSFHWRETMQQVTASGSVARVSEAEATEYFDERPIAARAATLVSQQGEGLADERALTRAAAQIVEAGDASRPPGWGAYRIRLERIEFWHGRASRLHRRLEYRRQVDGWVHRRLQP